MFTKIKSKIRNRLEKLKDQVFWNPLINHKDDQIKRLASTLKFIKSNKAWTSEDRSMLKTVLQHRKNYAESAQSIKVLDYGAGDPAVKRSKDVMESGVEKQMQVSRIYELTSSPNRLGQLLFKLVREFKPRNCLELGTSLGVSAMYQISALKLNGTGKLISIEGAPEVARVAHQGLLKFDYNNFQVEVGKFNEVLDRILDEAGELDFVFIDGHHDKDATKEYFEMIYPYLSPRSLIIFDDIHWSKGMQDIWQEIFTDNRIKFSAELSRWGICLLDKEAAPVSKNYIKLNL